MPLRTRGGGFVGEVGLGVTLTFCLGFAMCFDDELRADAGVALLLTFALGRKELDNCEALYFTGDGGLETEVREGGREVEGVVVTYASFTVTLR